MEKFKSLPGELDQVVSLIGSDHGGTSENPRIIKKVITFELPPDWEKQVSRELRRLEWKLSGKTESSGFWGFLLLIGIVIFVFYLF